MRYGVALGISLLLARITFALYVPTTDWKFTIAFMGGAITASLVGIIINYKSFFCAIGWHSFPAGFEHIEFDGCSEHARCKWCGYEGMIDSQGNLF